MKPSIGILSIGTALVLLAGCNDNTPAQGDDDCVHRVTRVEVDDSYCDSGNTGYEWVADDEGIDVDKAKKKPVKPKARTGGRR